MQYALQVRWADLEQRRAQARVSESYKYIFSLFKLFLYQCLGEWAGVRGGADQLGEQGGPGEGGQQGAHRHQDHPQQIPLRVPQLAASPHIPLLKQFHYQRVVTYNVCMLSLNTRVGTF